MYEGYVPEELGEWQTEQQEAQHAFSSLLAVTSGLMMREMSLGKLKEDEFGSLARIIYILVGEVKTWVDKKHSVRRMSAYVGSKEIEKNRPLMTLAEYLKREKKHQEFVDENGVKILIWQTNIPGVWFSEHMTTSYNVTHKNKNFYLIGQERLPKGYQFAYPIHD